MGSFPFGRNPEGFYDLAALINRSFQSHWWQWWECGLASFVRKGRWPPVLLHSTLGLFEQDKACCVAQAGLTDFMPQSLGYRYYSYVPQYLAPRLFLFCIWSISITLNSYFCQSCPGYSCLMWKRNPSFFLPPLLEVLCACVLGWLSYSLLCVPVYRSLHWSARQKNVFVSCNCVSVKQSFLF